MLTSLMQPGWQLDLAQGRAATSDGTGCKVTGSNSARELYALLDARRWQPMQPIPILFQPLQRT